MSATTKNYINPVVNSITVTGTTATTISISVNASGGTNSVATYYYSINNGAYSSSTSNTKTFTGLASETNYSIKVYVTDTNEISSSEKTTSAKTSNILLAEYIKGLYTSQGSNGIYYHKDSSLSNSAADYSYRYSGANPNNYVCFGSNASTCPSDNLYRIIGVFYDEVKLIKSTSYGSCEWSSKLDNTWSTSDIKITLNTTYYNTLSSTWQNKISTHIWKVGGMNKKTSYTAKQYYDIEVGSSSSSTTDSMKIGLMYVSDYGFAASNSYWTTALASYSTAATSNWLYLGSVENTISRLAVSYSSVSMFLLQSTGNVITGGIGGGAETRPCFYLTSSTTYVSGSGTSSDPIRIN